MFYMLCRLICTSSFNVVMIRGNEHNFLHDCVVTNINQGKHVSLSMPICFSLSCIQKKKQKINEEKCDNSEIQCQEKWNEKKKKNRCSLKQTHPNKINCWPFFTNEKRYKFKLPLPLTQIGWECDNAKRHALQSAVSNTSTENMLV